MKRITILFLMAMILTVPASAAISRCMVHKGEWVWLRATPSPDGEQIGKIRFGTDVDVREIKDQYAHVVWDGGDGWADVSYFLFPHKEEVYTTRCSVNKRETPNGRYLTRIKEGSRVSVLGWRYDQNGELWAYTYKGGYVKAEYLKGDN